MGQSLKKRIKCLETARLRRLPVRLHRPEWDDADIYGYPVALTQDWAVLNELADGVYLDGLALVRLDDVTRVRFDTDAAYVGRAVEALGRPVETFECPAEISTQDLLKLVATKADLVGVSMERWEDEPLFIGKILRVGKKRLDLHFIGSDGVWVDVVDRWRLRDITKIEFGGRYTEALERFGDERPEPHARKKQ